MNDATRFSGLDSSLLRVNAPALGMHQKGVSVAGDVAD
jgi:hypothetical protein